MNAGVHLAPALATRRYEPGLLTATMLFAPLTALAGVAVFGRSGKYSARAAVILLAAGVFMHAVLGGGVMLFLKGAIPNWGLVVAQPTGIALGYLAVALAEKRGHAAPSS